VAGKDRERRLAREHWERQQERRSQARERARRRGAWVGAAVATVLVVGGVDYLATVGDDSAAEPAAGGASEPSGAPSPEPSADGSTAAATGECTYRKADPGAAERTVGTPPAEPDTSTPARAVLDTNRGEVRLALHARDAPCTVGSFRHLADEDWFAGSRCHRLPTEGIFVLQCGDPSGTGQGGPGYEFDEENLPEPGGVTYPKGTVAMARTAEPGTNGSQFFLVYDDTTLPPDYTVFGRITGGWTVLDQVADAGTADGSGDGPPRRDVVIRDVTVTEQKA
jgi:peptidyl-prolyl cis-trans isomerase B (cyclophilin B)